MKLSVKTKVKISDEICNVILHMQYAAYKLWNICNYEKRHYKENGHSCPNWVALIEMFMTSWCYRSLPSQTAQQLIRQLDANWRAFFTALANGKIENPHPPKFKHEPMAIRYVQNGIKHEKGSSTVRLSLPKGLKEHMSEKYGISIDYIFLDNTIFKNTDNIKQIVLYPPENGEVSIVVVYEVEDVPMLEDNGRYMSIDIGVHNFLTCYISTSGETFIAGRKYQSTDQYFYKEIAEAQEIYYKQQKAHGVEYPKMSKRTKKKYAKRRRQQDDYIHKTTKDIVKKCVEEDVHTVVVGDITGILKKFKGSDRTNQQMHALPFDRIIDTLEYKLKKYGIRLVRQEESWTSQCSPLSKGVSKRYAKKGNRIKRGLYIDGQYSWNADVVGAFNILRKYLKKQKIEITLNPFEIKTPYVLKVAA